MTDATPAMACDVCGSAIPTESYRPSPDGRNLCEACARAAGLRLLPIDDTHHSLAVGSVRAVSRLGVAGAVLGGMALLVCWVPHSSPVVIPLALLGLALSVAGAVNAASKSEAGLAAPVLGAVLSIAAILGHAAWGS